MGKFSKRLTYFPIRIKLDFSNPTQSDSRRPAASTGRRTVVPTQRMRKDGSVFFQLLIQTNTAISVRRQRCCDNHWLIGHVHQISLVQEKSSFNQSADIFGVNVVWIQFLFPLCIFSIDRIKLATRESDIGRQKSAGCVVKCEFHWSAIDENWSWQRTLVLNNQTHLNLFQETYDTWMPDKWTDQSSNGKYFYVKSLLGPFDENIFWFIEKCTEKQKTFDRK